MDAPRNSPICNSIDRLSNLPETLIHYIFSFMDMTHVVRTCVLSKRWKHLWTCTPVLNFDFDIFSLAFHRNQNNALAVQQLGVHQDQNNAVAIQPYQKFIQFVDQVFIQRDGSDIQRLNLVWGKEKTYFDITASLTSWIAGAVRRNVQELKLYISAVKVSRFPQCLFTCTTLIKLELELGGNSRIMVLPAFMGLPRLTFMKLDSLPSTDIVDFVSKTSSKIKVDAPNLVSFECVDFVSKVYVLENLASLVTAVIDMTATKDELGKWKDYAENQWLLLSALSNAKELRLREGFLGISLWGKSRAKDFPAAFSNLRVVKLHSSYLSILCVEALGCLFHFSPNVESLSIEILKMSELLKPDDENYWAGVSLSYKLDHLRSVELRGLQGYYNELKLVEILFKSAVLLEKMFLYSSKEYTTDKRLIAFGEKLPKLPRASSNVTTFLL